MNIDLLNRVADQIEAHPENLAMDAWAVADVEVDGMEDYGPALDLIPECGTAACVAGWTLIESGYEPVYSFSTTVSSRNGKWYRARYLDAWKKGENRWDSGQSAALAAIELGYSYEDIEDAGYSEEGHSPIVCQQYRFDQDSDEFELADIDSLFMCVSFGPKTISYLLRQWAENPNTEELIVPEGWDTTE